MYLYVHYVLRYLKFGTYVYVLIHVRSYYDRFVERIRLIWQVLCSSTNTFVQAPKRTRTSGPSTSWHRPTAAGTPQTR